MRAAVLVTADGRPESVELHEVPRPRPGPGEVLVAMRAAPINPSDLNYLHGAYAEFLGDVPWNVGRSPLRFDPGGQRVHPTPPFVLGGEGMGQVVETGSGWLARRLRGKRVAVAGSPVGLMQDFAIVNAKRAVPLDDAIDDVAGAMVFVNPLTALALVDHVLRLPRGATLVQTAAGGALAAMVRHACALRGVRTIDLVRSEAGREALARAGVAHALVADDSAPAKIAELTRGAGAEGAIDCVGGATANLVLRALGLHGHLVLYGTLGREAVPLESRALMMRAAKVEGFFLPHFLGSVSPLTTLRMLRKATALIRSGAFRTPVRESFELARITDAFRAASAPGAGKVVVRFEGPR